MIVQPAHTTKCIPCRGSGWLNPLDEGSGSKRPCPVCRGRGTVDVPEMVHLVSLQRDEYELAMKWLEEHAKTCDWAGGRKYAGAIGGVLSWTGANTSIGQIVSLECTCGSHYLASRNL